MTISIEFTPHRAGSDHRESSDDYRGVLFRHGDYRVAECRDDIQWLLQRRRARKAPGGAAWDTIAYFVTRKALHRVYQTHVSISAPEIYDLPLVYRRAKGGRRNV